MKKSVYVIMSITTVVFIFMAVHTGYSNTHTAYSALAMDHSTTKVFAINEGQEGIDVLDSKTRKVTNTILRDKDILAIAVDGQRRVIAAAGERKLHNCIVRHIRYAKKHQNQRRSHLHSHRLDRRPGGYHA
jgi:DNA-binding beta-propeller fold protein YncE